MKSDDSHYDIHAYLDGELSEKECKLFEKALSQNVALADELEKLRRNKHAIVAYYQQISPPSQKVFPNKKQPMTYRWTSLVASLCVGVVLGVGGLKVLDASQNKVVFPPISQLENQKVVLHLDSKDPSKIKKTLLKTEFLLQNNPHMQLEVVANYQGIQLFDANSSSVAQIKALLAKYDNLRLVACQNALERARTEGNEIQLLQGVKSDRAAIDEVVERMREGWTYIKI